MSRNRLGVAFLAGMLLSALVAVLARARRVPESFNPPLANNEIADSNVASQRPHFPSNQDTVMGKPDTLPGYARWLVYFAVILLSVVLLIILRTPMLPMLFWGMVVVAAYFALTTRHGVHSDGLSILDILVRVVNKFTTSYYAEITQGTVVITFALLILTAFLFRPAASLDELSLGVLTFVAGGAALGSALRLKRAELPALPIPAHVELPQISVKRWPLILGILGIFLFSEVSGQVINYQAINHTCSAQVQPGFLQNLCLAFDLRFMNAHLQFALLVVNHRKQQVLHRDVVVPPRQRLAHRGLQHDVELAADPAHSFSAPARSG